MRELVNHHSSLGGKLSEHQISRKVLSINNTGESELDEVLTRLEEAARVMKKESHPTDKTAEHKAALRLFRSHTVFVKIVGDLDVFNVNVKAQRRQHFFVIFVEMN